MRHIRIAGDPFAVGHALGREAGPVFRDVVSTLDRYKALQVWRGTDRLAQIEAHSRRDFPLIMREMDGIADGAEADFQDVLLWNCRGDLPGAAGYTGAQGCTDILIPAEPDSGLPAVIGHNEDDAPELAGRCFVATVQPDDGPEFTSFVNPGQLPGHTFAVNGAGIVQTINHIRPRDTQPGIGRHVIARAVLACESLQEVRDLLERTDRAAGFHHNLGQSGDMTLWSVEAPASGCEIVTATTPRAHANHLYFERFSALDQEIATSSRDRQRRADELIASGAVKRDPMTVLADSAGLGMPICRKTVDGGDSGYTLLTAIFELSRQGVHWRVYDDPREKAVLEGYRRTAGAHVERETAVAS